MTTERYVASLRRARIGYAIALAAAVVVFGTIFVVVWATGSAAHATLHTSTAPTNLPLRTAATTQTRAWHTTDRAAEGAPQWEGTVVTWSAHTLRGRDARTGRQTWSYTRTDRTICTAGQVSGIALAVFRRDGDCDEVDALDAGTGSREWARTLDEDGKPINGTPNVEFSTDAFVVQSAGAVYAIQPTSGVDFFTYTRYGCTIQHAVVGSAGVLISQTCGSKVACSGVKFCGRGRQLLLDPLNGRLPNAEDDNKDQLAWNLIGYTGVPASADAVVSAVQPGSNVLDVLDATDGSVTRRVELSPAPTSVTGIATTGTDTSQVVWIDGHVYVVASTGTRPTWVAASGAAPTVVSPDTFSSPQLASARITIATGNRVETLDGRTGVVAVAYDVAAPADSAVYPLGSGFLVATSSGTTAYS